MLPESQEPYEPLDEPGEPPEDQPYEPTVPADAEDRASGEGDGGVTYRNADEEAEYDESGDQG